MAAQFQRTAVSDKLMLSLLMRSRFGGQQILRRPVADYLLKHVPEESMFFRY